jgi:hypothetical protein
MRLSIYSMPHTIEDSSEKSRWFDLLSIASRYQFDKARELAIKELNRVGHGLGPVAAIMAALKHDIPQWLLGAITDIVMLPCMITDDEASQLPFDMLMCLWRSREEHRNGSFHLPVPFSEYVLSVADREAARNEEQARAKVVIKRVFKDSRYISYINKTG